ncbi:MAG: glycosyltransferase, partial [Porticoccaceae bacterium]|nr:glycosyltransferase [Porticoccaceae bacterium]
MIIFGNRAHYAAIGGVENSIRSMFRIVSKQQGQAIVVCREPVKDEPMDLASMTLPLGIELATYRDDYDQSSLRRLRFMRHGGEALPKLYRNLYNRFPEATIIVRHHMHVLAASHAGFRDIRYLVPSMTINQLREELPSSPTFKKLNTLAHMLLDGWLQSRALSKAKLFVLSVSMQEQVQQRLRGRYKADSINIVKPGVDHLRFMPPSIDDKRSLRQQLGLPLEQKLFLFVGRFVQAKGLDYLLDAFVTQASNCSIVLVGEGECEDAIRGKIKSLKIQDRALLVGRTSKVEDFYRASDVFV